ncbi:hypothetical protein ATCC90586_004482 [Pythium insidiosum]|nr:hypothetical protein ATCC90586_004482 [Pythium insidiosum]
MGPKKASKGSKAASSAASTDGVDRDSRVEEAESRLREEAKIIVRMTRDNRAKQEQIQQMEALLAREIEKHQAAARMQEDEALTQRLQAEHEIEVLRRKVSQLELHVEAYDVMEASNRTLRERVDGLMQQLEEENRSHAEEIQKLRLDMFNHKMALEKTFRKALQELDAEYLKKAFNAMSEESKNALVANAKLKDELQLQSIGVDNLMQRFNQQAKHYQKMRIENDILEQESHLRLQEVASIKKAQLEATRTIEKLRDDVQREDQEWRQQTNKAIEELRRENQHLARLHELAQRAQTAPLAAIAGISRSQSQPVLGTQPVDATHNYDELWSASLANASTADRPSTAQMAVSSRAMGPDAALVRGRAKVAPADAQVLHLESAGLHCLRGLEACGRLRSLYASDNPLRTIDGVSALTGLWRIDLSQSPLRDLSPLATFAALGFVHIENGQLSFSDLRCLREAHILELRVAGNNALVRPSDGPSGDASPLVYRERVVALLPNVWVLDGHFVSTRERTRAIERQDAFVMALLTESSADATQACSSSTRLFGSTTELWAPHLLRVRSDSSLNDSPSVRAPMPPPAQAADAMILLKSLDAEPTRRPELQDLHRLRVLLSLHDRECDLQDLHRLRVLLSLHDRECDVHNASCHLAPSRHSSGARPQPRARLAELLALPRRCRLGIAVLLAARLEFQLPSRVVSDALTLVLLSAEHGSLADSPSSASLVPEDLAQLPPYCLTALLACLRDHALQEEDALRQRAQLSTTNAWDEFEARLWRSTPVVFTSLLGLDKDQRLSALARTGRGAGAHDCLYVTDSDAESFSLRCAYAVSLLAKAASCPDATSLSPNRVRVLSTSSSNSGGSVVAPDPRRAPASEASLTSSLELAELRHAARAAPSEALDAVGITPPLAFAASDSTATRSTVLPWRRKPVERDYRRPWSEATASNEERVDRGRGARQSLAETTRRPRPGECIEVQPKTFLHVRALSEDKRFVVASPHAGQKSSDAVSIRVERLVRVSGSMWRLETSADTALDRVLRRLRGGPGPSARLGRLHRESEAFHRHGAARTQGFPNRDISTADLRALGPSPALELPVPRPVELFAAHDTLDANYVLTSPSLVAIQNACATRSFKSQRRPPAGLWGPIEKPSFQVTSAEVLQPMESRKLAKESEPDSKRLAIAEQPEAEDDAAAAADWQSLQHDLASLLGRQDESSRRHRIAHKSEDVACFITRLPGDLEGCAGSDAALSPAPSAAGMDKSTSAPTLPTTAQFTPPSATAAKQRMGPLAPLWHHVPTKPQLLVAVASPPSRQNNNNIAGPRAAGGGDRAAPASSVGKPSFASLTGPPSRQPLTLALTSLILRFLVASSAMRHPPDDPIFLSARMALLVCATAIHFHIDNQATKPVTINPLDAVPRVRWNAGDHRFHYTMPIAAEPGSDGFVLLQEFERDSYGAWALPKEERVHLEEMERMNHMIHDVENAAHLHDAVKFLERQRSHHQEPEFHERVVTEDDLKPRAARKKDAFPKKHSPKQTYDQRRVKPTRVGRVQQPK